MSISFECPGCGEVSILRDRMAGKAFRCPDCGRETLVPVPDLEADEDDTPLPDNSGRVLRFLAVGGFVALGILGVLAVMAWRMLLDRQAPPAPPVVPQIAAPALDPGVKEEEWLKRAAEALARDDHDLAISCCSAALQLNSQSADAYRLRADAQLRRRMTQEETETLESVFQSFFGQEGPSSEYKRALADYTQAITLKPDDGRAYAGRAIAYAATGDTVKAVDNATRAEKLGISPADAGVRVAAVLRKRGQAFVKKRQSMESGDATLQALTGTLGDLGLGSAEEGKGASSKLGSLAHDYGKQALACFQAARQLNPKDAGVYEDLAMLYLAYGQPDEALKAINLGLARDPKRPGLFFFRGAALYRKGDRVNAEADYQRAVKADVQWSEQRAAYYK